MARLPQAVLDTIIEQLDRRLEIFEAYLFGSQARGDASARSDVDVAVYIDRDREPPSKWGYAAELITDLMAALGRNDIDVVVLNDAPPLLYHRVLRDGDRLLSRDLAATTTREGYALSRCCGFLPQLQKIDREAFTAHRRRKVRLMTPDQLDPALARRHLLAPRQAVPGQIR